MDPKLGRKSQSSIENLEFRFGSGSSQTSQTTSGDFCRICHESDYQNPLLTPCLCSGSLRYVHQQCLQTWINTSETSSCELCKFPFIMQSKIKPFNQWKSLEMTGIERRRLLFCVLFHLAAALCVIWSLVILIERAADEIRSQKIGWPFWTKLTVVTVGLTGGIVFMYIQCKQYLNLCARWRARNRILLIANAPEKTASHITPVVHQRALNSNIDSHPIPRNNNNNSSGMITAVPIADHHNRPILQSTSNNENNHSQTQIVASIENNSLNNYEIDMDDMDSQMSFKQNLRHEQEGSLSRGSLHNVYDNTSISTTNTSATTRNYATNMPDNDSILMKAHAPLGLNEVKETDDDNNKMTSIFVENDDILSDKNYPKLNYRHSTFLLPTTNTPHNTLDNTFIRQKDEKRRYSYSDTKLLNNIYVDHPFDQAPKNSNQIFSDEAQQRHSQSTAICDKHKEVTSTTTNGQKNSDTLDNLIHSQVWP